jgi:hypothetical protein
MRDARKFKFAKLRLVEIMFARARVHMRRNSQGRKWSMMTRLLSQGARKRNTGENPVTAVTVAHTYTDGSSARRNVKANPPLLLSVSGYVSSLRRFRQMHVYSRRVSKRPRHAMRYVKKCR